MYASYFSSSTCSFYLSQNDQNDPPHLNSTVSIPIDSPSDGTPTPIPVPLPGPDPAAAAAAVRIQAAFRSHLARSLVRRIRAFDAEAGRLERLIQRQDTVEAVRRDGRERIRVGEGLMELLLRLDAVPGFYLPVRELRRRVSRRIVGLQEVLDAVVGAPAPAVPDGFPGSWEEIVAGLGAGEVEQEEEAAAVGAPKRCFECLERFLLGVD